MSTWKTTQKNKQHSAQLMRATDSFYTGWQKYVDAVWGKTVKKFLSIKQKKNPWSTHLNDFTKIEKTDLCWTSVDGLKARLSICVLFLTICRAKNDTYAKLQEMYEN